MSRTLPEILGTETLPDAEGVLMRTDFTAGVPRSGLTREQVLEDALSHLPNAVRADAAPDLLATAVHHAELAIQFRELL